MIIQYLLFCISINAFLFAIDIDYTDFGTHGTLYNIQETNGNDMLAKGIKDINITKVNKLLAKQVEDAFVSNISLPDSTVNSEIRKKDFVPARWDVIGLNGTIMAKKGDLILSEIPKGMTFSLCFINGDNPREIIDYVVKEFGNCIYMVNKIDSRIFNKRYRYETYPISNQVKEYLTRYNVTKFPTKITKKSSYLYTKTLNIVELKRILRNGLWEKD